LIDFIKDKEIPFGVGPKIVFFETVGKIQIILPFVVIISSLISFWQLTKSSELIVLRALGQSFWRFITPLALMVLAVGILEVTVINPIAYSMEKAAFDAKVKVGIKQESLVIQKNGFWLKDGYDNLQPVIFAENIHNIPKVGLKLENIAITVIDKFDNLESKIYAASGILKNDIINLSDVRVFLPGESVQNFENMNFKTTLTLDKIEKNLTPPKSFSFWNLPAYIKFLDEAGFSSLSYKIYYASLWVYPFFLISLLLLCASFSLTSNLRGANFLWRTVLSIVVGFMVYFFNQIILAMGNSGTLPIWLAASGMPLIAILCETSVLLHLEDG
jgi:lipopolysaccharide export system permease protein